MAAKTPTPCGQPANGGPPAPINTAEWSTGWNTTQVTALTRHEQELQQLRKEVAFLKQHVSPQVSVMGQQHRRQQPPLSLLGIPAASASMTVTAKQPLEATKLTRQAANNIKHQRHHSPGKLPDVAYMSEMGDEASWLPYERAYTENSVLMPWIPRRFYQLRWMLMNRSPLTRRFLYGQFTYGEALATFLIVAEMLWILIHWIADTNGFRRNVRSTGHASSLLLMSTYIVAIHNNSVFLLALGLPFDRALPWHKLMAFAAILNSLVHGSAYYLSGRADSMPKDAYTDHHIFQRMTKAYGMEVTGWMLLAAMVSMSSLALPFLARHSFTTFYRTHILLAITVFVFGLFHGFGSAVWHGYAPMSVPGALFWFIDLFVRFVFMNCLTTTKKAKLRRINPAEEGQPPVVQFSVPNTRAKYTAGQWVFICIPKLGILHWHPFSISSASLDSELTLHFVCNGKWTSQVARLAEDNSEMKAYIEGPYGAPMIDVHSERYKCFLIISSGMGWTFLRSWKRQLVQDSSRGRHIKAITTVSIMRHCEKHLVEEFSGWAAGNDFEPREDVRLLEELYLTGKPAEATKDVGVGEDAIDDDDCMDSDWVGNPNPLARDVGTSTNLGWGDHSYSLRDRSRSLTGISGAISRLARAADYASSAVLKTEGTRPDPDEASGSVDAKSVSVQGGLTGEFELSKQLSSRSGLAASEEAGKSMQETFAAIRAKNGRARNVQLWHLPHSGSSINPHYMMRGGAIPEDPDAPESMTSLGSVSQKVHASYTPPQSPHKSVHPSADALAGRLSSAANGYEPPMHRNAPPSPAIAGTPQSDSGIVFSPHTGPGNLPSGTFTYHNSIFNVPSGALSPRCEPAARGQDQLHSPLADKPHEGVPHAQTEVKYGRPDIHALFAAAAAQAKELGEERVAVLICSNKNVLLASLAEAQWRQGTQVDFDVHYEAFGF